MPATVIVNARLVNEGRVTEGDLRIENGRIARIAAEIRPQGDDTVIDAAGRWPSLSRQGRGLRLSALAQAQLLHAVRI